MELEDSLIDNLIVSFFEIGSIKFGQFKLKSGLISPIYFDLRLLISHPHLLGTIGDLIWRTKLRESIELDVVCGVPYTALPVATVLSSQHQVPMILKRKERKGHGTGQILEGVHKPGTRCLVIEDVTTTGSSIVETAQVLREHEIVVTDVVVILDRDQGARQNLKNHGINLHALITVNNLLFTLRRQNLITEQVHLDTTEFLSKHSSALDYDPKLEAKILKEIIPKIPNANGKALMEIIWRKKSNLCLSADLEKWWEVIEAVELLGPQICCVKTHVDALDFDSYEQVLEFRRKMLDLSTKFGFLIMEDRKFSDIGSTVHKQVVGKPFEIAKWAHLVTAHGVPGAGILQSLSKVANLGVVLVAEMSSEGNLASKIPSYKAEIARMSRGYEEVICGYVSQSRVDVDGQGHYFVQFTPGVGLEAASNSDGLGQQYCTVEEAVFKREADVIIVGRGILQKPKEDWINTAEQFKISAWNVWANRILLLKDGK